MQLANELIEEADYLNAGS